MWGLMPPIDEPFFQKGTNSLFTLLYNPRRRWRIFFSFYLLLALTILLVTSTYTWFSISRTPRVTDMRMYISAGVGLSLAENFDDQPEDWGQSLDFQELIGTDTVLRPATWSVQSGGLVTADYGMDGRILGTFSPLSDSANANRSDSQGYYVKGTFYARSDAPVEVSLGEAVELNEGRNSAGTYVIGTPIWDQETLSHYNGAHGAETAIRIGLAITPVDPETGVPVEDPVFYIYEPNYDKHILSENTQDVPTPSIDGTDLLVDEAYLIRQTASTWTEAYPVENQVTIKDLGEFTTNTRLFALQEGEMVRLDLYMWLEGQDVDCANIVEETKIIANLLLAAAYEGQSGLQPIS